MHTDAVHIAAAADAVHAYLADAENLPAWAPTFAQRVQRDGDELLVNGVLRMAMPRSAAARTVDFVAAADPRIGLFTRVVPSGDGCECVLTMGFPSGTPDDAVRAQMDTIATELQAIRSHTEGAGD